MRLGWISATASSTALSASLGAVPVDGKTLDLTDGVDRVRVRAVSVETVLYRDLTDEQSACSRQRG
jgi:hypothetical protein